MPEYINKDYYKKLAPNERSFINLTAQNIKAVMNRLEAEHIMFSATVGYKNTITVSNADREKVLKATPYNAANKFSQIKLNA